MVDYDICLQDKFSKEAFEKLFESIKSANTFQKCNSQKVWLTTANVWDALSKEFIMQNNQFVIVPEYTLPTGVDGVMLLGNPHMLNRAERRRKQKEERRRNKKNEIYTSTSRIRRLGSSVY
jgi:hypothetical protein